MRRCRVHIGSILVLLLCSTSLMAAEEAKIGPWVKINEKDGIVAYVRTNSRTTLKEGRVGGVINSSTANIENMMRDWEAYKMVLFMSKKAEPADVPGCKAAPDTYCAYLLQGAPWPVEDRDGYGSLDFYVHKPTNEVLVKVTVGENSMPLTKGVTRIPFCEMEWMIKPIDATHCQVTYQNMVEPGGAVGSLPAPIINYIMKYFGIFTLQNIRKLAKEDKYQHATGIITQTPWPEELRFYAEEAATKP